MSEVLPSPEAITRLEVRSVDLPFRLKFKHAAAARSTSSSIFVKCTTESGAVGYGESLPREYVTQESREGTHELLRDKFLPRLLNRSFSSYEQVKDFLRECDGKAPEEWGYGELPQTAAWCAVDLALLDSFGHHFKRPVFEESDGALNPNYRYSGVISASGGWSLYKTLLKLRVMGIRQAKVKLGGGIDLRAIRKIRWIMGKHSDLRIDLNMLWSQEEALELMGQYAEAGIQSFEQPLPVELIQEMAELVDRTGLFVMADESLNDAQSLSELINRKACNAVNVRISKCGGLMAAISRSQTALDVGMMLQVGCQVGESSLLSSAQLALMTQIEKIRYLEGCFSTYLLEEDPVIPALRFGYGGKLPRRPEGDGLGVSMNEAYLERCTIKSDVLTNQRDKNLV